MTTVVAASTAGTAFEWYDFFLFVPLAAIMSKVFFADLPETTAYFFALSAFAVGFAFRPLGALIFGRIGDRRGASAVSRAAVAGAGPGAVGWAGSAALPRGSAARRRVPGPRATLHRVGVPRRGPRPSTPRPGRA